MRDRIQPLLKLSCAVLAGLFIYQLAQVFRPGSGAVALRVPEPPPPTNIEDDSAPGTSPPVPGSMPPQAMASMPRPMPGPGAMAMPPGMPPGMMPGMSRPGGMPGGDSLPPEVQARVDHIVQQELFGPVPKPLPMALMGIAGADVMLRAPNGQMGLIAIGEELGGVKLLQIGTNRILIEHEGEQKELTLFSGYGGESLLTEGKETPQ